MCCKPFPASSVLPAMKAQLNMLSPFFWGELAIASFLMSFLHIKLDRFLLIKPLKKKVATVQSSQQVQALTVEDKVSLLDLPELALDCILERLSPPGLCSMALVCSSMRDKCRSDYLWEKHMRDKWGRLIRDAAHGEWQCQVASTKRPRPCGRHERKGFIDFIFRKIWPFSWVSPSLERENEPKRSYSPPGGSVMALYLSLESGKFLFPAQVYNRENGHSGFMLSCYDALLSYDSATDTFQARYLSHGRRTVEENIPWHRLRAPPVATPPHELHVSDCLNDLRPGDHVEIQWRKSKEFPYGWWYGIVGHLESCDGGDGCCGCHYNDNVVLEFNQYPAESRWRRTVVNRKQHREEGNEVNGFYGGIRKLYRNEEISVWKRLWPSRILE